MYVYCRGRAVTNVGKTCGPTPCFVLAINTFKLDAFKNKSRCLDDVLNINNIYLDNMVGQELQLSKANTSDTEASVQNLHLPISNDIGLIKIYDTRDDFVFEIVNFQFLW